MARGFSTIEGVGTSDAITTALSAHATQRSYCIWVYRSGDGGGSLGRMFEKRTAGAQVEQLYNNTTNYGFARAWSGDSTVEWRWPRPAANVWSRIAFSYDAGSTGNVPVVYQDGALQTLTPLGTPSGSVSTNSDVYVIGNRTNDSARCWSGMLAEFAIWDTILTAAQLQDLSSGAVRPQLLPTSRVLYVPMIGPNEDLHNSPPTITGTKVQTHPFSRLSGVNLIRPRPFAPGLVR